ncbi:MAG: DUF4157 domain-containing protein [Crocinitomicaceae bacterium]
MSFFKSKTNKASEEDSHSASRPFIGVQAKLNVGSANDKYEKEADRVADKVVNQSKADSIQKKSEDEIQQKSLASEVTPYVQKMEAEEEASVQKKGVAEEEPIQKMEEEEPIQKMEEEEPIQKSEEEEGSIQKMEEEESVQAKNEDEAVQMSTGTHGKKGAGSGSLESRLHSSKGSGRKLSDSTRNEMETGFGNDFSNVNIHSDQNAIQMSKELGARAFTHGNDIYFNQGEFDPSSSKGKHLLAHELTHTIQQTGRIQRKPDSTEASSATQSNKKKTTIKLEFNAFIPNSLSGQYNDGTYAWKWEPGQVWGTKLFASDNRDYKQKGSSRIWQNGTMTFEGETLTNRTNSQGVGESHQADAIQDDNDKVTGIKNKVTKKAPDKGKVSKGGTGSYKGFNFLGEASYPFSNMAPDIDFDMKARVLLSKSGEDTYAFVSFNGTRNSFPAYEAIVTVNGKRDVIYNYSVSSTAGPGLWNLNTWKTISASSFYKL